MNTQDVPCRSRGVHRPRLLPARRHGPIRTCGTGPLGIGDRHCTGRAMGRSSLVRSCQLGDRSARDASGQRDRLCAAGSTGPTTFTTRCDPVCGTRTPRHRYRCRGCRSARPSPGDAELRLLPIAPVCHRGVRGSYSRSRWRLLPGTLTAYLEADRLVVHALDRGEATRREIAALEDSVARMFRTEFDRGYHMILDLLATAALVGATLAALPRLLIGPTAEPDRLWQRGLSGTGTVATLILLGAATNTPSLYGGALIFAALSRRSPGLPSWH